MGDMKIKLEAAKGKLAAAVLELRKQQQVRKLAEVLTEAGNQGAAADYKLAEQALRELERSHWRLQGTWAFAMVDPDVRERISTTNRACVEAQQKLDSCLGDVSAAQKRLSSCVGLEGRREDTARLRTLQARQQRLQKELGWAIRKVESNERRTKFNTLSAVVTQMGRVGGPTASAQALLLWRKWEAVRLMLVAAGDLGADKSDDDVVVLE